MTSFVEDVALLFLIRVKWQKKTFKMGSALSRRLSRLRRRRRAMSRVQSFQDYQFDITPVESKSSNSDTSSENKEPRIDPNLENDHKYWKQPLAKNKENPVVFHIIHKTGEEEQNRMIEEFFIYWKDDLYTPRIKCKLLAPNWMQYVSDREIRLTLRPMAEDNVKAVEYVEGRTLLEKVRYLLLRLGPDKTDPSRCVVSLQENHGNHFRTKIRRFRPLYVKSVFVDHNSWALIMEGSEFCLTIATPFQRDVDINRGDPGGLIDVGMYQRELDTHPSVKISWYITARSMDLPDKAFLPHIDRSASRAATAEL